MFGPKVLLVNEFAGSGGEWIVENHGVDPEGAGRAEAAAEASALSARSLVLDRLLLVR